MNNIIAYRPRDIFSLFEDAFSDPMAGMGRVPAVDLREEKERYIVDVELPGMNEKDVELTLADRILTIASAKEEKAEEGGEFLMKERRRFSFSRSFSLPSDVDGDKVSAVFKNGLLEIEIPKRPDAKEKRIDIRVA